MLLTAVLAAAFPQPSPAPVPDANPALWMVRDADTTVYLFGTFHTLDGRSEWFNDDVRLAFSASDELILETLLPKMDRHLPQAATRVDRGHRVPSSANFAGATRMAVTAGRERGLDVRKGADMVLRAAADDSGKRVEGLETFAFQLDMLGRMSPGSSIAAQRQPGEPSARDRMSQLMSDMQASWNRGDQRIFAILLDQMRQTSPRNYSMMFPERNGQWASWIVNRMDRPGTVFVAVGAGHFAGRDSVLAKLTSRGVVATRLN